MIAARQIAFGRGAAASKPYDAEVEYLILDGSTRWNSGWDIYGRDIKKIDLTFSAKWEIGSHRPISGHGSFSVERGSSVTDGVRPWQSLLLNWTTYDSFGNSGQFNVYRLKDCKWHDAAGNELCETVIQSGTVAYSGNLYLYGTNSFYSAANNWAGGVRLVYDNEPVFDLIPVVKDGVGEFYDRVSGTIWPREGGGAPTPGPIKEVIDYTAKDYVQDGLVAIADGKDGVFKGGFVADYFTKDGEFLSNSANIQIPNLLTDSGEFTAECVVGQLNDGDKQNAYPFTFSRDAAISTPRFAVDGLSNTYSNWRMLTPKDTSSINYQLYNKTDIVNQFRLVVNQTNFDIRTNSVSRLKGTCFNDGSFVGLVLEPDSRRCVRIYNRVLTDEEAAHNDLVDKARFGL